MAGAVKGSAIASVVEDVNRLVADGRLRRLELEVRLQAEDIEVLDAKILPSNWYPLATYGRLTEVLLDVEGKGSTEYLVERGRRAAERLKAAGLYAQLSVDRDRWGERVGQMMMPLGPTIYRDTVWRVRQEETGEAIHFEITTEVPDSFPDLCRHQTQGFIEYAATQVAGRPVKVVSARLSPTKMVFRGQAK
jgi:hypothetical protein